MTCIAYKNGIMAGDSCWSNDETGLISNSQNKILRLPHGALYGGAGDADDRELVALLQDVKTPADLPSYERLRDVGTHVYALVVFPDGAAWWVETKKAATAEPVHSDAMAIGSGKSLALGAMAMGGTAEQAVEIACEYDIYCRPPVHVVPLKP